MAIRTAAHAALSVRRTTPFPILHRESGLPSGGPPRADQTAEFPPPSEARPGAPPSQTNNPSPRNKEPEGKEAEVATLSAPNPSI